jgi:hypothetical protein
MSTVDSSVSEETEEEEGEEKENGEEEKEKEEEDKKKKGDNYGMGRNVLPPPSGFSELRRS